MWLEAPRRRSAVGADARLDIDPHEALAPAGGGLGRLRADAMGLVAVGAVKRRAIAERPVYLIGPGRVAKRVDVGLQRAKQGFGRVGVGAENGLAADDDKLVLVHDVGCGSYDMLEVRASHA